jgi:hypothetical protein
MKFLTSPDVGAPRAEWETWLVQLRQMDRRDESVIFAIRRAQAVLAEMCHDPDDMAGG